MGLRGTSLTKLLKKKTALQRLGSERNKPRIVLFGETADKSSPINLMAGKEVSVASPDLQRCTMHWKDYILDFGDETYKVIDTTELEEPQLGIREYLESVDSAYRLIKELDRQGGVHACILAADGLDGLYKTRDDEVMIGNLVKGCTANGQKPTWIGGDNLFVSLMRKLRELSSGNLRVKGVSIVSCLMKRCDASRRVARKLAYMIKQDAATS
ncbi:hypothetical protein BDR04DRAFT_341089 [Suillus decipiens]|nr:hypothetical protein BDR04DRAFT_341089 [Suillus decipiens]